MLPWKREASTFTWSRVLLVAVFLLHGAKRICWSLSGCTGMWEKMTCWPSADVGEAVSVPCPKYLFYFSGNTHPRKNRVRDTCDRSCEVVLRSGAPGSPGEEGLCVALICRCGRGVPQGAALLPLFVLYTGLICDQGLKFRFNQ